MRARDRDKFKQLLLDRRRQLTGSLNSMADEALKTHGGGQSVDDIADMGSDQYEQELTLSLMASERVEVKSIDDALDRVDAGTYGKCLGCPVQIPAPRLNAVPAAEFCIECQSHVEKFGVPPGVEEED
ncbi:MAG: DnaK suppressor protein [Planctomycetota bacterium]|jgi:DnaK suppressor protein